MDSNSNTIWIKDILILFAIPLLGYTMSISFEFGYASYFGIPSDLIKVEITSIYSTLLNLFTPIFGAVSLTFLLSCFFDKYGPIFIYFERFFYLLAVIFAIFIACPKCWLNWSILFIVCLIYFIIWVIVPLRAWPDQPTFRSKIKSELDRDINNQNRSPFWRLLSNMRLIRAWNIVVIIFLVGWYICWTAGMGHANNRITFPIIDGEKELVILKIYNNIIISAPFDRNKKEVRKEFVIINIDDKEVNRISIESVGPLKPIEINRK